MIRSSRESAIRTLPERRLAAVKLNVLIGKRVLRLDRRRAGVVVVKLPRRDRAVVLHAARYFDHTCRTEIRPRELLFTRPYELHRLAARARQTCSFDRTLAGVFTSVTRSGVRNNHTHVRLRNVKRFRQFRSHTKRSLRSRPHRQLVVIPLGDCCARFERRVRDVRNGVRLRQFLICGGHTVGNGSDRTPTAATRRRLSLQLFKQLRCAGLCRSLPMNSDRLLRPRKYLWIGRGEADEIAVANDVNAPYRFSSLCIRRYECRIQCWRPDYATQQHSRSLQVGRVRMDARNEIARADLRHRLARDGPIFHRRDGYIGRYFLNQFSTLCNLSKAQRLRRVPVNKTRIDDSQISRGHFQLFRRQGHQSFTRSGRCFAQLWRHERYRAASERAHVERCQISVRHDHANHLDWHVQLFGDYLGQRGANVLAQLHLARIDRNLTLFVEVDPGADVVRHALVHATASGFTLLLLREQIRHRHQQRDAAREHFQKLASIEREVVTGIREQFVAFQFQGKCEIEFRIEIEFFFHFRTSFDVPEAISIALTIRK